MNEQEKAQAAAASIKSFVDQFGEPSETSTIILQILLEELYYASPISILSEPEQEGNQTGLNDQDRSTQSEVESKKPEGVETSPNMGIQDSPGHQ